MAKGRQVRAMTASFSCYIQIMKERQQLSSSAQQPVRCVCNLQAEELVASEAMAEALTSSEIVLDCAVLPVCLLHNACELVVLLST